MTEKGLAQEQTASRPGPRDPLSSLQQEFDRLFEDFFREFGTPFRWRGYSFGPFGQMETEFASFGEVNPRADVIETDQACIIMVELPGLDQNDIEVSMAERVLTIDGDKSRPDLVSEGDVHLSERRYGHIRRSFRIPDSVDDDAISATFDKGVLTILMPKGRDAGPTAKTRIEVSPS